MRDAVNRAIRTFLQAFLGVFLGLTVSGPIGLEGVPDAHLLKRAAIAAAWAGVIAVLSWLQNYLEETGTVPKVLKDKP